MNKPFIVPLHLDQKTDNLYRGSRQLLDPTPAQRLTAYLRPTEPLDNPRVSLHATNFPPALCDLATNPTAATVYRVNHPDLPYPAYVTPASPRQPDGYTLLRTPAGVTSTSAMSTLARRLAQSLAGYRYRPRPPAAGPAAPPAHLVTPSGGALTASARYVTLPRGTPCEGQRLPTVSVVAYLITRDPGQLDPAAHGYRPAASTLPRDHPHRLEPGALLFDPPPVPHYLPHPGTGRMRAVTATPTGFTFTP